MVIWGTHEKQTKKQTNNKKVSVQVGELVAALLAEPESDRAKELRESFESWAKKKGIPETWENRRMIHILAGQRLYEMLKDFFQPTAIFYFTNRMEAGRS